uniref:Uncharacterized protein n=1 Tax=Caenorhabditis japonica TaxID=281687 RepID=A0A8R1HW00_CAEJA
MSLDRMDTSEVEVPNDREIEKITEGEKQREVQETPKTPNQEQPAPSASSGQGQDEDVGEQMDVAGEEQDVVDTAPKTPRRTGRVRKLPSASSSVAKVETAVTPGKRGRKRKGSESVNTTVNSVSNEPKTPARKTGSLLLLQLTIYYCVI